MSGSYVYLLTANAAFVYVIDPVSLSVIANPEVPGIYNAQPIAVAPDNSKVYVVSAGAIYPLDTTTFLFGASIGTTSGADAMVRVGVGASAQYYVSYNHINPDRTEIAAIDVLDASCTLVKTLTLAAGSTINNNYRAFQATGDGKTLAILTTWNSPLTGGSGGLLSLVSTQTNTVTANIDMGEAASALAISADSSVVYVAGREFNTTQGTLRAISLPSGSPIATYSLPNMTPTSVALSKDGATLYVSYIRISDNTYRLAAIRTSDASVLADIAQGNIINSVVTQDGSQLYVLEQSPVLQVTIYSLPSLTVLKNIPYGYPAVTLVEAPFGSVVGPGPTSGFGSGSGGDCKGNGCYNALTWAASAGATSYDLQRGPASGGPYAPLVTGLTGTTYHDPMTTADNGVTYWYEVRAVNSSGASAWSAPFSVASTCPICGCTNPLADNFSRLATKDDGSCVFSFGDPFTAAPTVCRGWTGVGCGGTLWTPPPLFVPPPVILPAILPPFAGGIDDTVIGDVNPPGLDDTTLGDINLPGLDDGTL